MPNDIVIQSWQGEKSLIEAASKGYNCILSNGYYIDLIQPTDFHYLTDPSTSEMPLTDQQRKHILGGEATMWSEFVSPETIDSRIWPRTAAIAERLWSPFEVNDVDDMYLRLDRISYYLEELGLQHEKNYQIMLKRLSNNTDYTALKNFIDIIEPVKIYRRNDLRPQTSFTPLTRVVDAARPDQKKARDFRKLVDLFLAAKAEDQNMVNEIRFNLVSWRDNHRELLKTIQISPILNEIESLSADLSRCAVIGLEALKMIESGNKASEKWRENSLHILKNAGNPRGQCELMVIDAIEKLILYPYK
jgi:hexosaminidase